MSKESKEILRMWGLIVGTLLVIILTFALANCAALRPTPTNQDCEGMCRHLDGLGCGSPNCLEVCRRHDKSDPYLIDEACIIKAATCQEVEACSAEE